MNTPRPQNRRISHAWYRTPGAAARTVALPSPDGRQPAVTERRLLAALGIALAWSAAAGVAWTALVLWWAH